jgi:hypothetical protein
MAAFTTAEKPNIKYHWELNPVKFLDPWNSIVKFIFVGTPTLMVENQICLRRRRRCSDSSCSETVVQLVKGANLQVFPAAYAISVLTFYQDADKRI